MVLFSILKGHPQYAILVVCLSIVASALYNRYFNGLNHVPCPLLASCTNLWRAYHVWKRRPELLHIELHEKYGPLVRAGPRTILVSDPNAVSVIYALKGDFTKSQFYLVQQTLAKGKRLFTLFTATDDRFDAKLRRAVSNAYAMSILVQFKKYVDSITTAFISQMKSRFADNAEQACNFSTWLQWYAFDVIGELTFSKRLGFLDRAEDVDGIIASIEGMLDYAAVIGQMPELDNLFLKIPLRILLSRWGLIHGNMYMVDFARRRLSERVDTEPGASKKRLDADYARNDLFSSFINAHEKDPDFITDERVLALTVANVFVGSDTISLRAVFYFLLRHPTAMQQLMTELAEQKRNGRFHRSDGLVDWNEVRELPYLSATIKESLRCHPTVGLSLERITPTQGTNLCGKHIPSGTIVGCSAWTLHRSSIFGDKPDEFRPDRWIEAGPEDRRRMENALFTFGAGSRTCIGKNISLLEMYKFVPAVLMAFEVSCCGSLRKLSLVTDDISYLARNACQEHNMDLAQRLVCEAE